MKKFILSTIIILGASICNAQTEKVKSKPVKPVPGQTPPQAPPKQPAPQMVKTTVTDSTNKVDSIKSRKIKLRVPGSLGVEKEHGIGGDNGYIPPKDTIRKPRFPWRE